MNIKIEKVANLDIGPNIAEIYLKAVSQEVSRTSEL